MESKHKFAMYVIGIVALLQGCAWATGKNGQVFAFTSLVIGSVAGIILGIKVNK